MRILPAFAAALLLLAPAAAADGERAAELLPHLDLRTPETRASAARTLAALGPSAMDELFALIAPGARGAQDEVLAASFALQPQTELRAFLGGFTHTALAAERLGPALLVLREAGDAHDLARCLELGEAGQPELISALTAILAREPGACEPALSLARKAGTDQAESLARALAQSHRPEAQKALVQLAGQRPELAATSLSSLLAEADAIPRPVDVDLLGALRELATHEDHPAAQELLLLAGRLDDDEAVPLLIERLSSPQAGLRANALWSLRQITGLGLGADAQAWSEWFGAETRWWKERAPALLPLLHSPDMGQQRIALGELGQRFWRRQQIARDLAEYLAHASAEGARMSCGLLARLRGPAALAALQSRVEDEDPGVRESARAGLASLTGKKIPSRSVGLPAAQRVPPAR